jgi:hypothetical protein
MRGHVLRPERLDRGQVVVGDRPAALEGHPERGELLAGPARAHAEDEAPARQPVEVRAHARGEQGMPVRQHDHRRAELHPVRDAGDPRERGERVVERRRVALLDVRGDRDVVRDHQEVIAERLGERRPAQERIGADRGPEVEQVDPELHAVPSRS